ncbi:MAG TPA: patatin-like phospholipase family protein [Syntrophorhabdaceae bacterium]|jgi:NTE family protein|nr:patatin-like phospholipase family protein [Syntrophorhabdaceae bacterium]MDI9559844.1 patatin-like phospholipase family protein [Pseudomonadota bacterium]HNZ58667.1 patatin-like phospholipase family protein [Syntrophorhabdaceae bacterium]HOS05517.1 patatin-like phospholipase family protein [Syntrophorhabdaceae bacterium]HOS60055.1 patatin-like phospholipase family protein [Syntrophorhabdaceae bacterium]
MNNFNKFFVAIVIVLTGILLSSCQSTQKLPHTMKKGEPKIALVLGGGSAKGFAHIGVIRVLEQEKIPIHMIVGTSVGSLIGGIYAANPDSFQLEWLAFKIDKNDILDLSIIYSKLGPAQGARLESFVEQTVTIKKIEDTKIPFFPIATDLNTGETIIMEKGSLSKAIRASSAIPGIFVPVTFGNRLLVDGGVTNSTPCDIARSKGADIVIAINLLKDIKDYNINSLVDIIGQSVNIMMHQSNKTKLQHADVIIEPDTKGTALFDFSQKKMLMEEGIKAAKASLPKIKEVIERFRQ